LKKNTLQDDILLFDEMDRKRFLETLKAIEEHVKRPIDRTIPRRKIGLLNKIGRGLYHLMNKKLIFSHKSNSLNLIKKNNLYTSTLPKITKTYSRKIGKKYKDCGGGPSTKDTKAEGR
jgi:hypothetical protein